MKEETIKEQGNLIVISGPSAAGKGTICKELLSAYPQLFYSVSATTRPPRAGEEHGVNYWFTPKEEFQQMIAAGELLEWAQVYGNYYGTPLRRVQETLQNGRDVILEIDPQGALQVQKKFPAGVYIYVLPPSLKELENRIYKRGTDSEESIERRMRAAADEINMAQYYHYLVVNDTVERAVAKIAAIIAAERCSIARNGSLAKQILNNKGE